MGRGVMASVALLFALTACGSNNNSVLETMTAPCLDYHMRVHELAWGGGTELSEDTISRLAELQQDYANVFCSCVVSRAPDYLNTREENQLLAFFEQKPEGDAATSALNVIELFSACTEPAIEKSNYQERLEAILPGGE